MNTLKHLNSKNIFLMDTIGAGMSLVITGGLLPLFSEALGVPVRVLYVLATFPLVYSFYALTCFLLPKRKAWMIIGLVLANSLYCVISGAVMIFSEGIAMWGYLFLTGEVFVLIGVIAIEWAVYRKYFGS